jgi:uncharacterized protein
MSNIMHLSYYVKAYSYDEPEYLVLYSIRTGSVILLEKEVLDRVQSGNLSPSEQELLVEMGYLVEDIENEKQEVFGLLDKKNENNKRFELIAVMNLDCNLSCTYCYEGDMKGKLYMSQDTSEHLTDFISNNLGPDVDVINIDFYGGEPLLSLKHIKDISGRVRALSDSKGIKYEFTLVTNGTLLNPRTVGELIPLGLKGAKITLDGPGYMHNKSRPFKGGAGSFDSIVRNLKDVCEQIHISVGGNFTRQNYHAFPELLDYLAGEGITPDRVSGIKFDPVVKSDNWHSPTDFRDGSVSVDEPWIVEASLFLREEILKRGYNTPEMEVFTCMVNLKDSFVVNHDGSIYKCPGFIGKEGFEAGDIARGVSDFGASHNLENWKTEECKDCQYLPFCFGGCRYMKFLRDGNIDGVDCQKSYLDATLEKIIKQDIKYRLKEK